MAQKGNLGFNTPRARKSSQLAACPHHTVTGDDDRDRIASASATHWLSRDAKGFSDVTICDGVSEWDLEHLVANRALKVAAMDTQRQIKVSALSGKIGRQLRDGFIEHICATLRRTAPIKPRDFTVFFCD